jgi:hypothetical protein
MIEKIIWLLNHLVSLMPTESIKIK